MGDDKIGEITAAQNEEITQGNDEVIQDVKDNKESILNDVREFNNVTVDGKEFIFVNAFGLVVMNTMDNSVSESFENIEQAVSYIENLLNKNVINEEVTSNEKIVTKEESFEITPVIHTDQIEGDEILKNDEKNNEQADVKRKPTINTTGVDRKGNMLEWLPVKFKNWLVNLKNKKGTPVTFSLPEVTKFSYDKKQMEAVKMLQSGDFTNKDFLYRHLPLQVDIDKDNFTFIATLQEDKVEEGTERYVARKNIVDAIINNSNKGEDKYKGITSTIDYQKGGELNYIQPKHIEDPLNSTLIELVENNISSLSEFNNNYKKVPLYFVKDDNGNSIDENRNNSNDQFLKFFKAGQKGYVYTIITAHNGVKVPVKMNVKKLELQQAYLVYEVYKTLYLYNKENKVKLNQNNAKLTDLYSQNAQLKATIEKFFDKELSLFKNQSKITVADFMTVFIHDNLEFDKSFKKYTTKLIGGGINFGESNFINFNNETEQYKSLFIDFLTTQKRQNIKLDFLAGKDNKGKLITNIDKNKYKEYLINNKVINVNLDTANPFKGDINVYVSSDIKSENPKINTEALEQTRKDLQEGLQNVETPNDIEAKKADIERIREENDTLGKSILQKLGYKNENRLPNGNVKGGQAGWKIRFNIKNPKTGESYYDGKGTTTLLNDDYDKRAETLINFLLNYFGSNEKADSKNLQKHYILEDKDGSKREPFKHLAGGEIGESDFTIYIGSADDVMKFISDIKTKHPEILELLHAGNKSEDVVIDDIFKGRIEGSKIGFSGYHAPTNLNKVKGSNDFTFNFNQDRVNINYNGNNLSDITIIVESSNKGYNGVFDKNLKKDFPELYKNIRNIIGFQLYGNYLQGSNDEFLKLTGVDKINAKYDAELAALENNSQNTLISENKDVSLPPGSKGGRFSKKNNTPSKPDGFSKKDC